MRKITTNIKTILVTVLAAMLCCCLIISACGKVEGSGDTYLITFIATFTIKEDTGWDTREYKSTPMQTNTNGRLSEIPPPPNRNDYEFLGWYTSGGTKVTTLMIFDSDTSVFAHWKSGENIASVEDGPVAKEFTRIRNALAGGNPASTYTVNVNADETILQQTLHYNGRNNITIILNGNVPANKTTPPIITLSGMGNLFAVGTNITLELRNIWLQGGSRNSMSLLAVNSGGKLIIGQNATDKTLIYNNGSEDPRAGGGVTVNSGGELIMRGGEISECFSYNTTTEAGQTTGGGGVFVRGGTFTMNGGTMHRNDAEYGGGVLVYMNGKFKMTGGEIYDNVAPYGGGVLIYSGGLFEMEGGSIHDNVGIDGGGIFVARGMGGAASATPYDPRKPSSPTNDPAKKEGLYLSGGTIHKNGVIGYGGGIFNDEGAFTYMTGGTISENSGRSVAGVGNAGLFIMRGGVIEGNTGGFGGGVDAMLGTFIMEDGKIINNKASGSGGGVLVGDQFMMHGGEISGNTADEICGGVYLRPTGFFAMSGGTIKDNKSTRTSGSGTLYFSDANTLDDSRGTAFYGTKAGDFVDPLGHWDVDDKSANVFIIDSYLAEYKLELEKNLPQPYPDGTTITVTAGVLTPIIAGE